MAVIAKSGIDVRAIDVDYRIQIAYTAPIEVFVDVNAGTVDRVAVLTGLPLLDKSEAARRETWLNPVPKAVAALAVEIAENSAPHGWPSWELVL